MPDKPAIDEALIAKLKAEHGDRLHLLETEDALAVFKTPDRGTYERYWSEILNEDERARAHKNLVLACVVYPPREEFVRVLDSLPGLVQSFGPALVKAAGAKKEATVRKL